MTDDRAWDRVEDYVQLIGRMEVTLKQADELIREKLGLSRGSPMRLSIAKRLAEAAELFPRIQP